MEQIIFSKNKVLEKEFIWTASEIICEDGKQKEDLIQEGAWEWATHYKEMEVSSI